MILLKSLNLYTTEDMLMTYLLCFIYQVILKNLQIIQILNTEILILATKRNL